MRSARLWGRICVALLSVGLTAGCASGPGNQAGSGSQGQSDGSAQRPDASSGDDGTVASGPDATAPGDSGPSGDGATSADGEAGTGEEGGSEGGDDPVLRQRRPDVHDGRRLGRAGHTACLCVADSDCASGKCSNVGSQCTGTCTGTTTSGTYDVADCQLLTSY